MNSGLTTSTSLLLRIVEGEFKGDRVILMGTGAQYEVNKLGFLHPICVEKKSLCVRLVSVANIKQLADARVGDTVTHKDRPAEQALEGFTVADGVLWHLPRGIKDQRSA